MPHPATLHRRRGFRWAILLLAGWLFFGAGGSGCRPATAPLSAPGYLLAGSNVSNDFDNNALYLFDTAPGPAVTAAARSAPLRVDLPRSWVRYLNRAPDGRLWIGLGGDFTRNDDRVQVYSAQGELLHTLRPCNNPEAGITFAAGYAFVGCTNDGFTGTVVVLDPNDFSTVTTLTLALPDAPVLLVGSGATERHVLLTAMTTGPDPQRSYALANIIDARQLEISAQISLGADTDIWTVLPHEERFYLLNVASARSAAQPRPDVLILDPDAPATPERLTLPLASPLWGQIVAGELYVYHHPGWNTTQQEPWRGLSRTPLRGGSGVAWSLPDGFEAGALAVWQGVPCLSHWDAWSPTEEHGLYCLDEEGALQLRFPIPDASGVLIP
ncbi:MAG: hypothetical protein ACLFU8_03150 [Anaerolineales bacterium]